MPTGQLNEYLQATASATDLSNTRWQDGLIALDLSPVLSMLTLISDAVFSLFSSRVLAMQLACRCIASCWVGFADLFLLTIMLYVFFIMNTNNIIWNYMFLFKIFHNQLVVSFSKVIVTNIWIIFSNYYLKKVLFLLQQIFIVFNLNKKFLTVKCRYPRYDI